MRSQSATLMHENSQLPNESQVLLAAALAQEEQNRIQNIQCALGTGFMIDLAEICTSPDSPLSLAVSAQGGRVKRYSHWNGYDLSTRAGAKKLIEALCRDQPRMCWWSPPCGADSPMLTKLMDADHLRWILRLGTWSFTYEASMMKASSKQVKREEKAAAACVSLCVRACVS